MEPPKVAPEARRERSKGCSKAKLGSPGRPLEFPRGLCGEVLEPALAMFEGLATLTWYEGFPKSFLGSSRAQNRAQMEPKSCQYGANTTKNDAKMMQQHMFKTSSLAFRL